MGSISRLPGTVARVPMPDIPHGTQIESETQAHGKRETSRATPSAQDIQRNSAGSATNSADKLDALRHAVDLQNRRGLEQKALSAPSHGRGVLGNFFSGVARVAQSAAGILGSIGSRIAGR